MTNNSNMKPNIYDQMLSLITQIQQAYTDKKKGKKGLSVLETSILLEANNILNQLK